MPAFLVSRMPPPRLRLAPGGHLGPLCTQREVRGGQEQVPLRSPTWGSGLGEQGQTGTMEGPTVNPWQQRGGAVGRGLSILALMLSLGLFMVPKACSVCLSASLLVVCL